MKTMIERASGYDLALLPMQTSLESWQVARQGKFNPSRLIKAEVCYVWKYRELHIRIATSFKEGLRNKLKLLLYYDWRRLDSRVYGTDTHLEHLQDLKGASSIWRLVKRAFPTEQADKSWDVGELVFRVPTEELKIYETRPWIERERVEPEALGIKPIMSNADGLAVCCSAAFRIDILCEAAVINVSGMRLSDGICRLGQAYFREEEKAHQLN